MLINILIKISHLYDSNYIGAPMLFFSAVGMLLAITVHWLIVRPMNKKYLNGGVKLYVDMFGRPLSYGIYAFAYSRCIIFPKGWNVFFRDDPRNFNFKEHASRFQYWLSVVYLISIYLVLVFGLILCMASLAGHILKFLPH